MSISCFIQPIRLQNVVLPQGSHVIYLGTWALPYSDLKNVQNKKILDHYYDDREKFYHDFEYIKHLYCELLPIIGSILNDYHLKKWEIRSLKLVYGCWLHEYLAVMKERFETIKKAYEKYPDYQFILTNSDVPILDSTDFKREITSDNYNFYIYSNIVKHIAPHRYKKSFFINPQQVNLRKRNVFLSRLKQIIKVLVSSVLQKTFNLITTHSKAIVDRSYFSLKHFFQLIIFSFPKISPLVDLKDVKHQNKKRNLELRNCLQKKFCAKFNAKSDFEEFLLLNIFHDMPLSFIENFLEMVKQSHYVNLKDKSFLSTNAVLGNHILQFALAEQLSREADLVIAQHGGSYGIAKWSMQQFYEVDLADKYITYGWSYGEGGKISTISHPKMLLKRYDKQAHGSNVLYVTWAPSRYFNRCWSVPIPGAAIQDYYENIQVLTERLSPAVKKLLKVRVAPSDADYAVGVDLFLDNTLTRSTGNFYKELLRASLVICDHNQTSMLECLCKNIPTIIVWNPRYSEVNDDADACLRVLADAGIFHNCHKQAANFINELINENKIDNWWNSECTQNAVSYFATRYSHRNRNWVKDYENILNQRSQN